MEFSFSTGTEKRPKADALVLPFWKKEGKLVSAFNKRGDWQKLLTPILEVGDFKGEEGECLYLYPKDENEKRLILLGLGDQEKDKEEKWRNAFGSLVKGCLIKKVTSLNIVFPHTNQIADFLFQAAVEGLLLANYSFSGYKNEKNSLLIASVHWIGAPLNAPQIAEKTLYISEGVYYARDLVNSNAEEVTPQYLAACARGLSKENAKIKSTILDKKQIEKEEMGLFLAVSRGSSVDPALIIMEYKGNPKSKELTLLVGKGVTYDTGGLNLKTQNMENMKSDMGGAAVCFGVMKALTQLDLKMNVTVVVPSTENAISANSFKPGEVYRSYAGKTVEILNTDAEGRLVLADALAYGIKHFKPTRVIDLATLTGGIEIALGSEATGLMSNHDGLVEDLQRAAVDTSERVWRMPLFPEYRERLKSDIADIKNWNGRSATSCVAAIFLKEFVGETPWAHLDIASTAYSATELKKYLPKYATGIGVRLILSYLMKSRLA